MPTRHKTRVLLVGLTLLGALVVATPPLAATAANIGTSNTASTTAPGNLNFGLIGYWPFDGKTTSWTTNKTNDVSGNGNSGPLTGFSTTTSPVPGKIGQALNFVSPVGITLTTDPIPDNGDLTFGGWVKMTGSTIMLLRGLAPNSITMSTVPGSTAQITVGDSTLATYTVGGTTNLLANKWYHVFGVRRAAAGTLDIYVNGNFEGQRTGIGATLRSTTGLYIGAFSSATIDDFRIYSRALSASEVAQLYRQGAATVAKSNTSTDTKTFGLNSGLVGYWPFDGKTTSWTTNKTNDVSGGGYTSTLTNMSTTTTPAQGKVGQALMFDGVNDYVASPYLGSAPASVTLAAWVKPNAAGGVVFSEQGTDPPGGGFHVVNMEVETNNTIKVCMWTGGVTCVVAGSSITYGKWYHVVMRYDTASTLLTGYVNGVAGASTVATKQSPGSLYYDIGISDGANGGNGAYFSGTIDDVRVYSRALSATEITQLYRQGAATVAKSNTSTDTKTFGLNSGLVGYWPFDGKYTNWGSSLTKDMSGQNNDGTLSGMSSAKSPTQGKIGQALNFDGTSSFVYNNSTIPYSTFADTKPITVSAWIKTTYTAAETAIVSTWNYSGTSGWRFSVKDLTGEIQFLISDANGTNYRLAIGNGTVTNGKWRHVLVTYDGSGSAAGMQFYIDGASDGGTALNNTAPGALSNATFNIGKIAGGTPQFFNGTIDDVRIYNRALSATEVKQLYLSGK